jgi:hypothetical protein
MKKINHNLPWIVFTCFFVLWSCTHKNDINDEIIRLDIRSATSQEPETFKLSYLASSINYIPLETNESCLLYRIDKILLVDDHIFITDGMKLFQFALSGNFVRQIGRVGKGPGEHGKRIKFAIDDEQHEILIYSSNVMNVYDLESGTYKRRFLINQDVSDLTILPKSNIIAFTYELPSEVLVSSICEAFLVDSDGIVIDSIPNFNRLKNKSNSRGYATTYEYEKNEIRYLYNYRDTLYRITEDFLRSPHAVFYLNNKISRDRLLFEPVYDEIQHPDFLWIPQILENTHFMFITAEKGRSFMDNPNVYHIVFDKKSGELISTSSHRIINDIDGGLPFWPRYASGKKLISDYLPTEIIDHYNSPTSNDDYSEHFLAMVKSLKENDNPVLVIIE